SKQYSSPICPKKRISPKNSDGSLCNGKSDLETKLRQLITLDNYPNNGNDSIMPMNDNKNFASVEPLQRLDNGESVPNETTELKQQREANNIYRAELKFIGSSSSLSSMYSELNRESLSPVGNHLMAEK